MDALFDNWTVQLTVIATTAYAMLLGGVIGFEREMKDRPAGFRTHMLVALGAALFVLVPLEAGMTPADLSRILQGVITGVGFLGAGAIIKLSQEQEIKGLTTAASIWLTAAIGVAAGMGRESTAILSTLFALFILAVLRQAMSRKKKETTTRIEKAN